jgi:hypothetical protein
MPNTYVALATQTLSSTASTVTFSLSGISGYTDLVLVINGAVGSGASAILQLNSDTGANYSFTGMNGNGSAASSFRVANTTSVALGEMRTYNSTIIVNIQNYSNSTTFKTLLSRANTASDFVQAIVGLWRNTSAVTSITLGLSTSTYAVGSTFSLYGIANADQGSAKATGGIITEDSQYYYHTFGASGAFIPKQSLTADVLVIAGGGGGGSGQGGGGGAGGVLLHSSQSLTAISYNCTIGGGASGVNNGTAPLSPGTTGGNGTNSTFGALASAIGGGGGSGYLAGAGVAGGSGGGGGGRDTGSPQAGGAPTIGQGFSGGTGIVGPNYGGGGGGGAGAAGANGNSSTGGAGGIGTSTYSSWLQAVGLGESSGGVSYIAAGGAGGLDAYGGLGGGGDATQAGGMPITVINGLVNTGSGGGGYYANRGAGGSGVIIVRYAK